uniref:non-specific serine/threonine protein kinase n=1 Tax=Quercus lobata TaxID=97700 RepID=A0A7N2RC42_QUELO
MIGYPFRDSNEITSDQQYCGYPGFGVRCENGKAVLGLSGDRNYYVKDINYTSHTLTLVDIDVTTNQTCPRPRQNFSLETLPLKYSSMDSNLSFYSNCYPYPPTVPVIPCLNISSYRSYVFVENHETEGYDWSKNCEEKVVVTVRHIQTEINIVDLIHRFGVAMNDGFVLDWGRVKDCVTCEDSEGYCGYDAAAEEFLCVCNDGSTHSNSCKGTDSTPLLSICQPHLCGDVNISYPFWVRNEIASDQQYYCGYEGLGVMCLNNGEAVLELPGDRYYVKDIDYADYTLTLVDIDVSNQTCPRARHNVSLEKLPLKYSSMDLNLSFYFNCISDPAILVPPILCLNINGSNRSYVFVENHETEGYDWSKNCEEKVVVTVRHSQINMGNLTGGFGAAMNDGFVLDWERVRDWAMNEYDGFVLDWERVKDCVTCEHSHGYCGYNATAKEFLCICKDGSTHSNSCKGAVVPLGVEASKTFRTLSGEVIDLYIVVADRSSLSATTMNTRSETGNSHNGFLVDKENVLSTKPRELENCNTTIKVPISRTALINKSEVVNQALQKALNQGFDVLYNALPIVCRGCMESGGKCGSNSTYPFVCHCHDGEHPYFCLRDGMHAVSLFTFLY